MLRWSTGLGASLVLVFTASFAPLAATEPADDFDALVDGIGRTMLARYPEEVTDLGLSAELGLDDSRLNDLSPEYLTETAGLAGDALDRLAAVDPGTLSPDERITHAVAGWYLDDIVTMARYADHEYALNYITGAHANYPEFMADVHPLDDVADAEAYLERLRGVAAQLAQISAALGRAETAGHLPTDRGLGIATWQLQNQVESAISHPLVTDFEERLASLDLADDEHDRLTDAVRTIVEGEVVPAYRNLLGAAKSAATRPDSRPGVLHHPGGEDYYAAALRHHTTTALTPQEVHDIGLGEVERVRGELDAALGAAGIDVDSMGFAQAIEASSREASAVPLRSDEDRASLLADTERVIADSEAAFGEMFTTLPSSAIEVQRPRPGREGGAGAYYRAPPAVGERPGIYYLSLAGDWFPMDTYATTNYHEAVPGHHFQIALQRESETLPLLQRASTFTGYAEGWALYAERLAHEAGLYDDDPLGNIGRLRMELLRAARAVADTGVHALGWSRDEAVEYLVEQGFPEPRAASEVDRYIVWPGQAPAYLIGMLEILRLRDAAQATLGDEFDLAAFHDAVLRHGSVPLEVLPTAVEAYVGETLGVATLSAGIGYGRPSSPRLAKPAQANLQDHRNVSQSLPYCWVSGRSSMSA